MGRYVAFLRGVNVGGKNIIKMEQLRDVFRNNDCRNVLTYINSGNVVFESDVVESELQNVCEDFLLEAFGFNVPVFAMTTSDFIDSLTNAPDWWNKSLDSTHDIFYIIPPMTVEKVCNYIGPISGKHEKIAYTDKMIFWTAAEVTYYRSQWNRVFKDKLIFQGITVRNANTTLKVLEICKNFDKLHLVPRKNVFSHKR